MAGRHAGQNFVTENVIDSEGGGCQLKHVPDGRQRSPPPDEIDLDEVFRAHHQTLLRYLARFTDDPDLAADALQEAYVRALERPPRHDDSVAGWLFRTATNFVRDEWRKNSRVQQRLVEQPARVPIGDEPLDAQTALERDDARQVVSRILDRLSAQERTVLLMREAGFSHREIAAAVSTTTKSVGTMLARAFRKFANEFRSVTGD